MRVDLETDWLKSNATRMYLLWAGADGREAFTESIAVTVQALSSLLEEGPLGGGVGVRVRVRPAGMKDFRIRLLIGLCKCAGISRPDNSRPSLPKNKKR